MRTSKPAALFASSAFLILVVACSSSTSPPPSGDGGTSFDGSVTLFDAGPILDSGPKLDDAAPPSLGSCTPAPGDTGNSKNVGAYCTKSGGQCSTYPNPSVQCSIDLSAQGANFCILIGCLADGDCGEDACCTGQSGNPIHACVPNGCFDAGVCQGIPQ